MTLYRTIVFIAITLFTLEGISYNGHRKSQTKHLEQKFDQMKAFPRLLPLLILLIYLIDKLAHRKKLTQRLF